MKDRNMPELFVGRSQGGEFDGTLSALPTAQERIDAAGGGPEGGVIEFAHGIRLEEDAERLARAWNCHDDLLAACEEYLAFRTGSDGNIDDIADRMKAAIAKARGD